ncbi:MAG TPA: DUF484 family protein [Nitrosospira sp.]|nr:DUF484 family protein [Nitrosospira sp.]
MTFNDEEIARYLKDNPGFFEQYGAMLADVQVPHPRSGDAIPITERQIVALREKNRMLQEKLSELIRFGEENGALIEKMHRLAVALLVSRRLDALLNTFEFHLREDFAVPHVGLRVWNMTGGRIILPQFARTSGDIHQMADSLIDPYCGHHVVEEIKSWFGEGAGRLRSFAMVALRAKGQAMGLLVLASEDPQRFYAGMGTVYLAQLGEFLSAGLERFMLADAVDS